MLRLVLYDDLFSPHVLSPMLSFAIMGGGLYGVLRCAIDLGKLLRKALGVDD